MKFILNILIILSLLGLLVDKTTADFASIPINDIGVWNDPALLRLLDNFVTITLGKQEAEISAFFNFVSTNKQQLRSWDRGELEWAWPLPGDYPLPQQFKVSAYVCPWSADDIERFRVYKSKFHFQYFDHGKLHTRTLHLTHDQPEIKLEKFDQIGISRWYVFKNTFLMSMNKGILVAKLTAKYKQPYKWKKNGDGELLYVFRTGSLWAGTIDSLKLKVRLTPDVELVHSNWPLNDGDVVLKNIEPKEDLILTVRRVGPGSN